MLTVVTWLWSTPGFRSAYSAAHVNTLFRSVEKHYPHEFRKVCITDMPEGIDADVDIVPLWEDFRHLPAPRKDQSHPGCYGRLKIFAREMKDILGPRVVSLDLDAVITGDLTPLWHRPEPFVIWAPNRPYPHARYPKQTWNASMWMMDTGAFPHVWDKFDGDESARDAVRRGFYPSDQGVLEASLRNHRVGTWTQADGVLMYSEMRKNEQAATLPDHARIVFFNGSHDYWLRDVQAQAPWILDHL